MRFTEHVSKGILLACVIIAIIAPGVRALPSDPNNAALLYYQAFLMMPEGQDQVRTLLQDLPYRVEPNDQVREYLKECQPAIDLAVAASQLPTCDWGLRYSQGSQMEIAYLAQIRRLAFTLRDESKILVTSGQYHQALERCLAIRRIARHVGDETLVSLLVATAINALADKAILSAVNAAPPDVQLLTWLQDELTIFPQRQLLIQNALNTEAEMELARLDIDHKDWLIEGVEACVGDVSGEWIDRVKTADAAFFSDSREYFEDHVDAMRAILNSPAPYIRKFTRFEDLCNRPDVDAKENPCAMFAAIWKPVSRILTLDTRAKSNDNMLKAAIEIYLVNAKTGSLPNRLPAGAPQDVFTGQDFKYEKTKDGFMLSRWTDDPKGDKTWQFEFKVK